MRSGLGTKPKNIKSRRLAVAVCLAVGLTASLVACGTSSPAQLKSPSGPHKTTSPTTGIQLTTTPLLYYKAVPAALITKFETCTIVTPAQVAAVLHAYVAFSGALTVKSGSSQGRHYCYYYVHTGPYAGRDVVSIGATFPTTKFWATGQDAQNNPATRPPGVTAAWFDGEYLQLTSPASASAQAAQAKAASKVMPAQSCHNSPPNLTTSSLPS